VAAGPAASKAGAAARRVVADTIPGVRRATAGLVVLLASSACSSDDDASGGAAGGAAVAGSNAGAPGGGTSGAGAGASAGTASGGKGGAAGGGGGSAAGGSGGTAGSIGGAGGGTGGVAAAGGAGGSAGTTAGASSGGAGEGGGGGGSDCVSGEAGIVVEGRALRVDGCSFHLRGVCWNPVTKGENHPAGLDYQGAAPGDAALMQAIGINVIRTYEPLTNVAALDTLYEHGIRVLMGAYVYGGDPVSVVTARVEAVKDHPAILGWVLGNEWNYNGLYTNLSHADALSRLNEAAALILAIDTSHPIVTVYGEVPSEETLAQMPDIDIWGINAYRGISFGDLFSVWGERSDKPMFLAEYGADAYNATTDSVDPESQAMATRELTQEIADHGIAFHADGVALGGTIFEWSDEWWKDSAGSLSEQDVGGIAPGGGPYPDSTFNEEWWGIVDIDRVPRPAYDALGEVFDALP